MYGSSTCPVCIQQKALFGDDFQFIKFHDCRTPDGGKLCSDAQIKRYPTWVKRNVTDPNLPGETLIGYQSLVSLASFAGCVFSPSASPNQKPS